MAQRRGRPAADQPFQDGQEVDEEALAALQALTSEEIRGLHITPLEERFPPVDPAIYTPQHAARSPRQAQRETRQRAQRRRARRYNLVTALALLASVLTLAWVMLVYQQPQTALNPFAPPVEVVYVTVTPLPGAISAPPQPTPSEIAVTEGPAFVLSGGLRYEANANVRGCEWASIAGNVTGLKGEGVPGLAVQVRGEELEERAFTGSALTFGDGGYELTLGDAPRAADYEVQLVTAQGEPLSDALTITTRDACDANVVRLDFAQVRPR